MRDQYSESGFQGYHVCGEHADCRVDVCTADGATIATVSHAQAAALVRERDRLIARLREMAEAFERADRHAFNVFWYGGDRGKR